MHGQDDFAPPAAPSSALVDLARPGPPPASWSDPAPTCGAFAPPDAPFHSLPEVGADFLGFHLIAELGRGTFGCVYLGRQPDLAGRLVALKVSTEIVSEGRKLARLQHAHIVPIHSLHRAGPLQAVCMPYFGSATLADVLHDLHGRRLPSSGRGLVSTLEERRRLTLASVAGSDPLPAAPPEPPEASAHLRRLEGLTHVEAVLWLGACLADGLAHAHERGIVHRDLKPANVLLTDDGQPMLLDFNLADDGKPGTRPRVGGTLPYMSPEHLAAYAGLAGHPHPDHRADLYSLGVILYELLAGRHPFTPAGSGNQPIAALIEARRQPLPPARKYNPSVSPAVESILRHCLHPDPACRYQSATHLREDLQRHLDSLPLRHAPEPSLAERLRKWGRRHPRLASTATLGTLSGLVFALLLLALIARGERLSRLDALAAYHDFQADLHAARLPLTCLLPDDPGKVEGVAHARRALARFGMPDGPGWGVRAARLPPAQREALPAEMGELLLLLAGAVPVAEGARLNAVAENCFPGDAPVAVFEQRARLMERLGRPGEAKRARNQARRRSPTGTPDRFLLARELAGRGRYAEALVELRQVTEAEPGHFAAWFLLGCCALDTGGDAAAAFTACLALRPEPAAGWHHRGMAHLRAGRHAEAEADLTCALARAPGSAASLVLRARAREGLGRHREALADLTRAGLPTPRTLLAASRIRRAMGDATGAARDLAAALALRPADEEGWVARGVARASSDPRAALADFNQALTLNPNSLPALQNRAHVLSEHLGRPREAADALSRILELQPANHQARAVRAVLLARLKDRAALADVALALKAAPDDGEILYQAGCVHALLSERRLALHLLARALKRGFGHAEIATDVDLANLRGEEGFGELLRCARTLAGFDPEG